MDGSMVAAEWDSVVPEHFLGSPELMDGLCRVTATWNKCTGFHFTGPYLPERRDLAVPTASFHRRRAFETLQSCFDLRFRAVAAFHSRTKKGMHPRTPAPRS